MVTECLHTTEFSHKLRRQWAFVRSFKPPEDLPEQYIRMVFGTAARYPQKSRNNHGWQLRFRGFDDHVAYLFAHELHHFRRRHLGMHPGEGEQSACRWAVQRATETGFRVEGVRIRSRRRCKTGNRNIRIETKRNPQLLRRLKISASHLCPEDLKDLAYWADRRGSTTKVIQQKKQLDEHCEGLRSLPNGAIVRITGGNGRWERYVGQTAMKVRTLRHDSPCLVARTSAGEELSWPMRWLEVVR